MKLGGTIASDPLFKNILSIGYEFETHDFTKLSLHNNKKTFINSDLVLRNLKEKMEIKSILIEDANYLNIGIPIQRRQLKKDIQEQPIESEKVIEAITHVEDKDKTPSPSEEEKVISEFDIDEDEFNAAFAEEIELEQRQMAAAAKENERYLEYFNENRPGDNKKKDDMKIKFNIINDMGDTAFSDMIKEKCKDRTLPKNEMYHFISKKGKVYDIKFSESISKNTDCESFSGVEYVVTYYRPKRENQNIILDTFVDACSRIIDHLGNLTKTIGTLMLIDDDRKIYEPIGVIENERSLYHKPNTNLYYMDTYDDLETLELQDIKDAVFVPQMTFRCMAKHTLDIMIEICKNNSKYTENEELIDLIEDEYQDILILEFFTENLIESYNETAKTKIEKKSAFYKTLKIYIFLIFFKIYMYIHFHGYILNEKMYLKDFLTFSSRHNNIDLYVRIKEILKNEYGIEDKDEIMKLFYQPDILETLYSREKNEEDEEELKILAWNFTEQGTYKYNENAFKDDLPETDPNYGNPLYSMLSYFKYFEQKREDWLMVSKFDVFSTTFDLKNDEILLENRAFRFEIALFLQNELDSNMAEEETLTVRDMYKIVNKFYGKNINKMMNIARRSKKKRINFEKTSSKTTRQTKSKR
jgi:hypothetical protein